MGFFDREEPLDANTSEFSDVSKYIVEGADNVDSGLASMQDAYSSYEFQNPDRARELFTNYSDQVRKKFGDTQPYTPEEALNLAPIDMSTIKVDATDPELAKLETINKWETQNLDAVSKSTDLNYLQQKSQLERGIKQAATAQRRDYYGKDNYLIPDLALRFAEGAVSPLADLVGADSITGFFQEHTDKDGSTVFGYKVGGDNSIISGVASGLGGGVAAIGAGVATGGWGTVGYLAASGTGQVVKQVRSSLENEGSTGEAIAAGAIEGVSQIAQVATGEKVFGGVAEKLLGKGVTQLGERVIPRIAGSAALQGTTGAVGGVISKEATNIGQDKNDDVFEGFGTNLLTGAIVGGVATGYGEYKGSQREGATGSKDSSNLNEEPPVSKESPEDKQLRQLNFTKNNIVGSIEAMDKAGDYNPTNYQMQQDQLKEVNEKITAVESSKQPSIESLNKIAQEDLKNVIQETEGHPPAKPEVIAKEAENITLDGPYSTVATLSDGSELIKSDQGYHLKVGEDIKPVHDEIKFVSPKAYVEMRSKIDGHDSDGTAFTLTTNNTGDLLLENGIASSHDSGKERVAIPTEENADGNVPVFVSKTRTTDGVRQNPFLPTNGKVVKSDGSLSAASVGFGGQKVSETAKGYIARFGPDTSEALGLESKSFEEDANGIRTEKRNPLITYFPKDVSETAGPAVQRIAEKGPINSLAYLNNLDKYSTEDKHLGNILVEKAVEAYHTAMADKNSSIDDRVTLSNFANEALSVNIKVSGEAGRTLAANNKKQIQLATGMSPGQFEVSRLKTELTGQADKEFQKQNGEPINLGKFNEEVKNAEAEVAAASKGVKEGEFVNAETQSKINEAQAKADKAKKRLIKADTLLKEKLNKLTPESAKDLEGWYNILETLPEGNDKTKVARSIFDLESKHIDRESSPDAFQRIYNFYRGNLLSGFPTQERNFWGNFTTAATNYTGLLVSQGPDVANKYAGAYFSGLKVGSKEAKEILKGNRPGRSAYGDVTGKKDKDGYIKEPNTIPPVNPIKNPFTFIQNAAFRGLEAADAFFYNGANEGGAYVAEYLANKNLPKKDRIAATEQAVYGTEDKRKLYREQLQTRKDLLQKAGIKTSDTELELNYYQLMEQGRSDKTREISASHGERSLLRNDPKGAGALGILYQTFESMANKVTVPLPVRKKTTSGELLTNPDGSAAWTTSDIKPLKFLIPFTRVATNFSSKMMEFTPVGTLKALVNKPEGKNGKGKNGKGKPSIWNHAMSDIDAKIVLGNSIAGSAIMAGFAGLMYNSKDEGDESYLDFYGYPEKGQYNTWKEQQIPNFSIRVGENIIPLQGTVLAIIPAILGGAKSSLKKGAPIEDVLQAAAVASLGAASTQSFVKSAGDLFDTLTGRNDPINTESGKGGKTASNAAYAQIDNIATGFIPASGFLNNLGKWMNGSPTETYNNLTAKILGDMPFAREAGIGKPQLNQFGEPITVPLVTRLSAGLAPHTIQTDPLHLWMQETGYDITNQGPILKLTPTEQELFGNKQDALTKYRDIMNEEQSREVLEISGPQIKTFLQRVSKDSRFQVKSKSNQKYIDSEVSNIRASAKYQVLNKLK